MTSLMIRSVILISCWIAQCGAEDLPINFWDVSAFRNGHFDNYDLGSEDRLHDKVEVNLKPVLIPGLQKEPVLYFEEVLNGKLYRRVLLARNESSTDHILYLTYYNITDSSQYTSETFSTDDLTNLTREDVGLTNGCQESYTTPVPGVIIGEVFDCRHSDNGQESGPQAIPLQDKLYGDVVSFGLTTKFFELFNRHPVYTLILTCDNFRCEPGLTSDETTTLVTYELKRKGPRYPLIGAPEGYVNPCQDDP